jgi:hypothetical protein
MDCANVQVTVELIAAGKTPDAAIAEAKRVVESALRDYGWSLVIDARVVCVRQDGR